MAELLVLRLLALVGAIALSYFAYRQITYPRREAKAELKLLKKAIEVASKTNGRITTVDLSLELDIPVGEADALLSRMTAENLAVAEVEETGVITYDIPRARIEK